MGKFTIWPLNSTFKIGKLKSDLITQVLDMTSTYGQLIAHAAKKKPSPRGPPFSFYGEEPLSRSGMWPTKEAQVDRAGLVWSWGLLEKLKTENFHSNLWVLAIEIES